VSQSPITTARRDVRLLGCALFVILITATLTPAFAQRQTLSGHVPQAVRDLNLQPIGRLAATNRLHLAIGLPLRNQTAIGTLLKQLYDPASPQYGQYLTPDQFAQQFGPTAQDYQAVVAFVQANGLTVTATYPNHVLVDVEGTVAAIENALHVTMQVYNHPTESRTFYAPDTDPALDLAIPILHIGGLDNYSIPRPNFKLRQPAAAPNVAPNSGSGPSGNYMGNDFRAAYVPGSALNGSGQNVGLLQFDGYTPSDIAYYENLAGLPSVTLSNVLIDGATGAPSGNGGEIEVSLDIEMVVSITSGGVSHVILYMAPNPSPWEDLMNQIAVDNSCKQISSSWTGGGPDPTAEAALIEMAMQGQSFFNASGDSDAYTNNEAIAFPADSTNVTSVGGTTLTTTGPGGSYVSETNWNWGYDVNCSCYVGSSGGISTYYSIPPWQQGVSMASNQGSTSMRNIPDVALVAANVYVRADGADQIGIGGTSCAAPLWAGFTALVNQQGTANGKPPVGFLNPALYNIGLGTNYNFCFHDITAGNNEWPGSPSKFVAVAGYDLCTGWGTPNGTNLINTLVGSLTNAYLELTGSIVSGGNGSGVIDADDCKFLGLIVQNIGGAAATGVNATLSTTTPGVTIAQPSSAYPSIAPGSTATNTMSFQISTSPSFVCGTPISLSLALSYSGGSATNAISLSTCTSCQSQQVSGGLTASSPTQTGRLTRNYVVSSCGSPKSCPGYLTTRGAFRYEPYSFTNTTSGTICVNVTITTPCAGQSTTGLFTAAYLGNFNPASLCSDYLADQGGMTTSSGTFSFTVPANTNFTVVVNDVGSGSFCSSYTLTFSGLPCYVDGGGACTGIVASFSATPTSGGAPLAVTFMDTSTGNITNRFWSFGDGGTTNVTTNSVAYTYVSPGVYSVTEIVTGLGGSATDTVANLINVYSPFAWWEQTYLNNTNCALCAGNISYTGDGMSNTNKFLAGFNPTNSAAYLRVISIATSGANVIVTYLGASGDTNYVPGILLRTNVLDFTTGDPTGNYINGGWQNTFQTNILGVGLTYDGSGGTGLGTVTNMTDFGGATNGPSRYYRVRVLLP
jgi:PKD repeat protein